MFSRKMKDLYRKTILYIQKYKGWFLRQLIREMAGSNREKSAR